MEAPHPVVTEDLRERLLALWERTGDPGLHRIAAGEPCAGAPDELPFDTLPPEEQDDWISTTLMGAFRDTGDPQVFALLYELNEARFLQAIRYKLRRSGALLDAHDVLQEVFLNIYRYPNRFVAERADAFRNWGHRIVRNTLLKFLKNESRRACIVAVGDEHLGEFPDARMRTPYRSAEEAELAQAADRAFLLYLSLYLVHFEKLSTKERRALTLVEVEGASYKQAANELGIRLENLKIVIFRGRRKVLRGMHQSLADLRALQDRVPPRAPSPRSSVPAAPTVSRTSPGLGAASRHPPFQKN